MQRFRNEKKNRYILGSTDQLAYTKNDAGTLISISLFKYKGKKNVLCSTDACTYELNKHTQTPNYTQYLGVYSSLVLSMAILQMIYVHLVISIDPRGEKKCVVYIPDPTYARVPLAFTYIHGGGGYSYNTTAQV